MSFTENETTLSNLERKEVHRLFCDESLVYQVYKQVGAKSIVFETVANMKKDKYYVTTKSPRPGDVIFWKKAVTVNGKKYWLDSHVGIYIGNGKFIDSSDVLRKVTTETITGAYKDGIPYYAIWSHK